MQYLGSVDLLKVIPLVEVHVDDLISADSYNETELLAKFNLLDKGAKELLIKCAIHISIIGSGNKTYGSIRHGNEVLEIKSIFAKYGIVYNKNINEKYEKNQLSARRLVRLLRFHIQQFIKQSKRPSYLWLKYSDRDPDMMDICFPGGEHLVENIKQAEYLLNTYKNLDAILNTKFKQRLERVYIARGIIKPTVVLQHPALITKQK